MGGGRGVMEKQSELNDHVWDNIENEQQQQEEDAVMVGLTGLKGRPPRKGLLVSNTQGEEEEEEDDENGEGELLPVDIVNDQEQHQQGEETPNEKRGEEDAKVAAAVQQVLNTSQFDEAVAAVAENIAEAASTLLSGGGSTQGSESEKSSVFLDKDEVVESTAKEILANEDFDVNVKNSDIPKSLTNGISYQNHEILQEMQTGLNLLLAEKSSGNENASFNSEYKNEHSGVTEEIKPEVAEWDVERVIAEQDTHDLFCPNCKSCITKRVILTKRKRNLQNVQYGAKREKTEIPVSGLDINPHAPETDDQCLDVTREAVGTNDREHDTGPDVFRCLSCFSFFIPTVSGFKLFRIFGGKDKGEKLLTPEQTPDANIRIRQQGDNDIQNVEEEEVQQLNRKKYPSDQKDDQVSLRPRASLPNTAPFQSEVLVNSVTQKSKEAGKDFVVSPNQRPILVGSAVIGDEERPDSANEKKIADVKNNSISSVATAFLFLKKSHANGQVEVSIEESMKHEKNVVVTSIQGVPPLLGNETYEENIHDSPVKKVGKGDDLIIVVKEDAVGAAASHSVPDSMISAVPDILPVSVTEPYVNQPRVDERGRSSEWDILKSIVYGGLVEAITSLGVVSSAAGGNVTTINIMALTLANLVSGLIVLVHGIRELKYEQYGVITDREEDKGDRYLEVLGWRKNYWRHAIVAVLSYLVFGLLPPLVYGFSFYKSDNKEYKMISVAAVSLIGIFLLAIGKAHVQKSPRAYSKTILYYLSIGVTASGLSFLTGELIMKFLDKVDWFDPNGAVPVPPSSFLASKSGNPAAWAYY